jgi:hypothetical protein
MMPSLHSITEHRRPRRPGRRRGSDGPPRARRAKPTSPTQTASTQTAPASSPPSAAPGILALDLAAQRVRAEGGPLDQASYSCQCGLVFAAAVTTSVVCPHCGEHQAW